MEDHSEYCRLLEAILDAYPYEVVYCNRTHTIRYMNRVARARYGKVIRIGSSLFSCHNEGSRAKIEAFLARADAGESEMFEVLNQGTLEREFFVPVRDKSGSVIGYFERHENHWELSNPDKPVFVPGV